MELITRETSTGDTEYFLFDPQSNREADIKTIICEETINECNWLDADDRFMEVRYYDWDENELSAIINSDGELLRKGIVEITNFIPPYKHFIILQTGDDLGIARFDYQADEEDQLFAVINEIGEYIVEPQPEEVTYNDYDDLYEYGEIKVDISGNVVE